MHQHQDVAWCDRVPTMKNDPCVRSDEDDPRRQGAYRCRVCEPEVAEYGCHRGAEESGDHPLVPRVDQTMQVCQAAAPAHLAGALLVDDW